MCPICSKLIITDECVAVPDTAAFRSGGAHVSCYNKHKPYYEQRLFWELEKMRILEREQRVKNEIR